MLIISCKKEDVTDTISGTLKIGNWITYSEIGYSIIKSTSIDHNDNSFVLGEYDHMSIQNIELNGPGTFLSKFNVAGLIQWTKSIDAGEASFVMNDSEGNIIISGHIYGTAKRFIAKYDNDGNHLWTKIFESSAASFRTVDLICDDQNNIYASFSGKIIHSGIDYGGLSSLVKLTPNGDNMWIKSYPIRLAIQTPFLINRNNELIMYGTFTDSIVLAGTTYVAEEVTSIYINDPFEPADTFHYLATHGILCLLNENGDEIKAKAFKGTGNSAMSMMKDHNDNYYLTGDFDDTLRFDAQKIVERGYFLSKFDSNLELVSLNRLHCSPFAYSVINETGIYLTGHRNDIYVDQFNFDGDLVNSLELGEEGILAVLSGQSLSVYPNNYILLAGTFARENLYFGDTVAMGGERHRVFIARINDDLELQ